jgi:hypothetical protein
MGGWWKIKVNNSNWKGKLIKIMLKARKCSDTYLATIRKHRWGVEMTIKKNIKWSFQLAQCLSSAEEEDCNLPFHSHLCTPAMSTNSSQVGVAIYPSF